MRLLLALLFFVVSSCAALYQPPHLYKDSDIKVKYLDQIKDWQERIKKEGWSEDLVDEVVHTIQVFVAYTPDRYPDYKWKNDYWFTPKEMIYADFHGDCEDIGTITYATFKKLKYPYDVRLLIVRTIQPDEHVLVKVKLPNGKWKTYETVYMFLCELDGLFFRPIVEFDEDNIWVYEGLFE